MPSSSSRMTRRNFYNKVEPDPTGTKVNEVTHLDAPFHFFKPTGSTHELISCPNVVHKKAVKNFDDRRRWDIVSKEYRMLRAYTTVTAHEDIPAFVGRDKPEVFALGFGALSYTAAHATFELVRRSNALVALLQLYGHSDRVADAVATPIRANARFDSTQRLSICMPTLESSVDEFFPDRR